MLASFNIIHSRRDAPENYLEIINEKTQMRTIVIKDSPKFLKSKKDLECYFKRACKKSIPSSYEIITEDLDSYGYAIYFINDLGYIILYVADNPKECFISFFCIDDSFNYDIFSGSLFSVCNFKEKPHTPLISEG